MTDGTKLFANGVYAYDKDKDIAVLKVYGYRIPTVYLANSDKLNINDKIVAIEGNRAEENTVTTVTIKEFNKDIFWKIKLLLSF